MKSILAMSLLCLSVLPLFAATDETKWCGTRGHEQTRYLIKEHEAHQRALPLRAQSTESKAQDVGEIAVITGDSRTLISPNPFDLVGKKITFQKNSAGGFDLKVEAGSVSSSQGSAIILGDDASKKVNFTSGFTFSFYGTTYRSVFVNSDGNLTLKTADFASIDRDVTRVLTGPPRIAAFFADLDPSAIGTINVLQSATKFTVTWNGVPEFGSLKINTFQVNLLKTGNIEVIFGNKVDVKAAVVGISPGNASSSDLKLVNYSTNPNLTGLKGTVVERFATQADIDYTAVVQLFHETHPQVFDFVVIFTDFPIRLQGGSAKAFFSTIQNQIKGIGDDTFNYSRSFGSPKISGMLVMGFLGGYPQDPNAIFFRPLPLQQKVYNTLELIAHESGHRWLFRPEVIVNGSKTKDLLGLQEAHYSFNVDADASVMEGNDVVDNGNGTFTTVAAADIYNKLDLYLMGFLAPSGVPSFFFVSGPLDKERFPETGVTVSGTRVDVSLSQIIQAEGARVPSSSASQKSFREAYILFTKKTSPTQADITKLDKIRAAFQAFFKSKTNDKGTMDTTLP